MSTVKVQNVQHPSAASSAIALDANGQATLNGLAYPTSGSLSGRNRIINGDMRIDQRNAGASVSADGAFPIDRFFVAESSSGTYTAQRSTTVPDGFTNSLLFTTGTATTPSGSDIVAAGHHVEGFNLSDLGWGTANAKPATVSFWVRSSLTGTFGFAIRSGTADRSYLTSYSISAANTWEYKTISIPAVTSGTFDTGNGIGCRLHWDLGVGSTFSGSVNAAWQSSNLIGLTGGTKVIANAGATFYITGVQLEAGTVATPFERRSYGQELALCQRYYQRQGDSTYAPLGAAMIAQLTGGETAKMAYQLICPMRSAPTVSVSGTNAFTLQSGTLSVTDATFTGSWSAAQATNGVWLDFGSATNPGWVTRNAAMIYRVTGGGFLQFSAEL